MSQEHANIFKSMKDIKFEELYFLEAAKKVRAAVRCGLGYVGGVLTLKAAQQVLDLGFDAVVIARALVHDPELVNRFRENAEHRSGCDSCNVCVARMYLPAGTYCARTDNQIPAELNQMRASA